MGRWIGWVAHALVRAASRLIATHGASRIRILPALAIASAAAAFAQTIDGTVTSTATSAPIPDVEVAVYANGRGKPVRELTTDAQGNFRIEGLEPGDYGLTFDRKGFDGPGRDDQASRLLHLGSGGWAHVAASMTPRARISGRVLDSEGKPVPGSDVWLFGRELAQEITDDQGRFAFENVRPGTYRIMAQPSRSLKPPPPRDGQRLGWIATFYPESVDAKAASDLRDREIRLVAAPMHRVGGVVRGASGPVAKATVTLEASDSPLHDQSDRQTKTVSGEDGRFEFPDVADGDWRLGAQRGRLRATAAETVSRGDLVNVILQLEEPFTLNVRVIFDPPNPAANRMMMPLMLFPPTGRLQVQGIAMPREEGTGVSGLYPGSYILNTGQPPPPYYLAAVQLGDRDVMGREPVEILSGALPVTITYRSDGGTVRGNVEDCRGAMVILVPQEARLQSSIQRKTCDANGRFEISRVRPADYYILALDPPPGADTRFFGLVPEDALLKNATRVTVRPSEATLVNIKVTTSR